MFYSTIIVPPLITIVRLLIHYLSRSSARRPRIFHQVLDAFGYTLSTHSEQRFSSGSDRIFLLFVALYALMVNLIFSGMLFDDQLMRFEPPNLDRRPTVSKDDLPQVLFTFRSFRFASPTFFPPNRASDNEYWLDITIIEASWEEWVRVYAHWYPHMGYPSNFAQTTVINVMTSDLKRFIMSTNLGKRGSQCDPLIVITSHFIYLQRH